MTKPIVWWWSSLLLACALPAAAQPRFQYRDAPLARVVRDVEARTAYRFFYRDALLDGKTVTLDADASALPGALRSALAPQGLGVEWDGTQLLLFALARPSTSFSGYVLDGETGARLPFATVTWRDAGGRLRGVVCNEAGAFALDAPRDTLLALTASFVGFAPRTVRVAPGAASVAFRLAPRRQPLSETTVTGLMLQATLDTAATRAVAAGAATGFAEKSTLRAIGVLPSVGIGPAFAPGPTVRGAPAGGFEVLLDGVPIYAPTHFFGLFEAFNTDALQAVAFYHDVAPAAFFAPPGGTLAYRTRTPSQRRAGGGVALTSTAARGLAETPLAGGRGSLLVGGRHSLLGSFGWMGNDRLVRMGLDVDRPAAPPPADARDFDALVLTPTGAWASFYDAHARLHYETPGGRRLTAGAYAGGDATRQTGRRYYATSPTNGQPRLSAEPVATRNRWAAQSASAQFQGAWGRSLVTALAALSQYHARFAKDDFTYERHPPPIQSLLRGVVDTLGYRNAFREIRLGGDVTRPAGPWLLAAGVSLSRFDARYTEQSGQRRPYDHLTHATAADAWGEAGYRASGVALRAGLRAHTFSAGRFARLSPRVRVEVGAGQPLLLALGYSRNYQFLHRLYLENYPSAGVWVLSDEKAPPSRSEGVTATVGVRPGGAFSLQVEGYARWMEGLREHATNSAIRPAAREATLTTPWLSDLRARSRGVEVLAQAHLGPAAWTNAYTLARTLLVHPDLNGGQPFRADWDRLHQFRSQVRLALGGGVAAEALWLYGTGTPNRLAYEDEAEPAALGDYHRLDVALRWATALGPRVRLDAALALYNAYDRANPWYRETTSLVETVRQRRRFAYYNVDVYDLGRTPSFEVALRW